MSSCHNTALKRFRFPILGAGRRGSWQPTPVLVEKSMDRGPGWLWSIGWHKSDTTEGLSTHAGSCHTFHSPNVRNNLEETFENLKWPS